MNISLVNLWQNNWKVTLVAGLLLTLVIEVSQAQVIKVSGVVGKELSWGVADLEKLGPETLRIEDHGVAREFTGVPLWKVLQAAGVTLGKDLKGKHLTKYLLMQASDGYEVVYALPEVDPEFTEGQVLVVFKADGKLLSAEEGPFRIVATGQKKHARWIRQLVAIQVLQDAGE